MSSRVGSQHDVVDDAQAEHRHKLRFLLHSAAALASTSVVTSGLGFVYWAVAARVFSATNIGESSTAISVMNLIAPFTVLGFGTLLIVKLPGMREGRAELVATAAAVSATVGAVIALVCAFLLPPSFIGLPGIGHQPGITVLFATAVATQGVGLLFDQALLSVAGGGLQLRRNLIQSIVKLVLLTVLALTLARFGSLTIFASWVVANVVSIAVVGAVLMRRHGVPLRRVVPAPSVLAGLHFDAAKHHALNIALFVPYFAMPIVANVALGSEQAGYLFATWSVAGFVLFLPFALATALFASGARDPRTFLMEFRHTLRYSLLISAAANVGILLFGQTLLSVFGSDYAQNGHTALLLICLGGVGLVVKDHHVALARIDGTVGREAVLIGSLSTIEVIAAAIGAHHGGLTGLGTGWLAAIGVEVAVCGPLVLHTYRRSTGNPSSKLEA